MKRFICGFLAGAMIFGAAGVFAAQYIANPVDFKVMVNGEEFISDPPALEVEGRTYLPLRAMGDALGVPVTWNEELGQAEVGNQAPVADVNQYSRNNPAPLNTVQTYVKNEKYSSSNYSAAVRVVEVIRGEENIKKVRKDYVTDDEPLDGYELMLVKVAFSVLSIKGDGAIDVDRFMFTGFTSNNEETESAYLHMEGKDGFSWLGGKLYAGGNTEGWIVLQVKKDDAKPKLAYGLDYNGAGGIWFALYE